MIKNKVFDLKKRDKGDLTELSYSNNEGYFIKIPKNEKNGAYAYTCREDFQEEFYNRNSDNIIGFSIKRLNNKLLNKFFEKIENQLKLKKKTIFSPGNINNTVIVCPSEFWWRDEVKFSLFSLLLRCGGAFYNGNFNKAITKYKLANSCRGAINWFLCGNTDISKLIQTIIDNDHFYGFVEDFGNDFHEKLIKPYNKKPKLPKEIWRKW